MNKASLVQAAVKASKAKKGSTQKVTVVNTPTVKIDHSDEPSRRMPPTLHLNSDDLPAIRNWKVGQKYKLTLEVTMNGIRQGSMYEMVDAPEEKKTSADFKVNSVKATS